MRPALLAAILFCPTYAAALEAIPDKLVVLTFDDASKSHFTVVRPLKKHGFGATFFVTEGFDFPTNRRDYMSWQEIAQLHKDGFEIGNHTRDHLGITDKTVRDLAVQVRGINDRCKEHGIPLPTSFAYPGNALSKAALPILKDLGIRFARRGGSPEYPYKEGRGFAYEPGLDHPLLIPSAGDARPTWKLDDFKRAVGQAKNGKIAVLQFHGVPDTAHAWVNTNREQFEEYLKYLADNRFQVIALRDFAKYVDPDVMPANPWGIIEERKRRLAELPIDATSLRHKVLCGYQGWFRCPGDPVDRGWLHWSRSSKTISPKTVTFEMWPDTSELTAEEKFPASGFTHADGKQAYLYSSAHPKTVERHFQWMQQYGIDGVFLQRFLVTLGDRSFDQVLSHVRASAAKTGRVYAICYDLTGASRDRLYDLLVKDWKRLVDEQKLTQDKHYLRHNGKPVLLIWGFFSDRFEPALAHRIIDFFKQDGPYGVTLIGGCQWQWRTEKEAEWARAFRRFDVISPWNVGNHAMVGGQKHASTASWKADIEEAKKAGMELLPVIYPGFGWTNLMGKDAARATIPRLGGEFFWRQFVTAADLGIDKAYVAMFDEVDEATAIFKVANDPPTQAKFATYEGLPNDWYLRLTGEGTKVIRGEKKAQAAIPIKP